MTYKLNFNIGDKVIVPGKITDCPGKITKITLFDKGDRYTNNLTVGTTFTVRVPLRVIGESSFSYHDIDFEERDLKIA